MAYRSPAQSKVLALALLAIAFAGSWAQDDVLDSANNSTGDVRTDAIPQNFTRLSKEECRAKAPYEAFATDDRIISCVRNASEDCCVAMNEYLGKDSDIYLCTCSNGVLEDVLEEGIPSFAKDLIHERIQECGLPVAGNATCDGLYDDAVNVSSASCADEKSPVDKSSYSCKEQADFGKCSESWMDGYCLASCGKCESASASTSTDDDDDDIPVSGDCSDEKSPVDKSDYTCKEQADYGKCDESWMDGYCLLSCGQCVPAANVSSESATNDTKVELDEDDDSILDIPAAASVRNSTNTTKAVDDEGIPESANCTDEKSPADNSDYTCEEQANFGKCDDGWMDGYCLASCGKCEGPSTLEVVAASTNTLVNGTCIDEPPASEVDCEMSAENGDCSKEFMEGFCLASCGKCEEAPRGANTNQSR